jgi:hypothetical protein
MSKVITHKQPVIASEMRFGKNTERAFGSNMELNATDRKDLLLQIANFMAASASSEGGVMTAETAGLKEAQKKGRREALLAAFNSREDHAELGASIAKDIYQAADREGFMRRFLFKADLEQGQEPRAFLRNKDVVAVVASSASRVERQLVRDKKFYPPEVYVSARVFIEQRDINQSTTDLLDEKFQEGLEATMVAEDRMFYNLLNASVGAANTQTLFGGTMNPLNLAQLRNKVTAWRIPAAAWLIANDLWNDIIGDSSFSALIDPASKFELLNTGVLGRLLGMEVVSDGYRHPQHRVLSQGEQFVLGNPENLGQYTDRGGIDSLPLDGSTEGIAGRGWLLNEYVSILVANARAVAKGKR